MIHDGNMLKLLRILLITGVLLTWGAISSAAAAEDCDDTYQVARGDTLTKIAARCGTTVKAILAANPEVTDPRKLKIGHTLVVPRAEEEPETGLKPQDEFGIIHIVKRGDRLSRLANQYDTTMAAILKANPGITNSNVIKVGQKIVIPQGEAPTLEGQPQINLSPVAGPPGTFVWIEGSGFPANELVHFNLSSIEVDYEFTGTAQADDQGRFSIKTNIPDQAGIAEEWMAVAWMETSDASQKMMSNVFSTSEGPITYIVKPGDSLSKIASRFGRSLAALVYVNPEIEDPRRINVGQELIIPDENLEMAGLPDHLLEQILPWVEDNERWIDVNLSLQRLYAYEGDRLVRTIVVSTGTSRTPTVTGKYRIYVKFPKADMRGPGYHWRDVPYVMYFHRGYGLHGTYWHNNFGRPMSAGCVNLSVDDAAWLFNFASVGTLVNVHN